MVDFNIEWAVLISDWPVSDPQSPLRPIGCKYIVWISRWVHRGPSLWRPQPYPPVWQSWPLHLCGWWLLWPLGRHVLPRTLPWPHQWLLWQSLPTQGSPPVCEADAVHHRCTVWKAGGPLWSTYLQVRKRYVRVRWYVSELGMLPVQTRVAVVHRRLFEKVNILYTLNYCELLSSQFMLYITQHPTAVLQQAFQAQILNIIVSDKPLEKKDVTEIVLGYPPPLRYSRF